MGLILVIDDSAYMRGKIRNILMVDRHETLDAADGIKGLQMATSRKPDLILLDIIMPGTDGVKILSAVRKLNADLPVVVVTADIQESVSRQCMELGAFAVIHKPPKEEELLNVVRRALEQSGGEK